MKNLLLSVALIVALAAFVGAALAADPQTPVEDQARSAVNELVAAYEARDVPHFMTLVSARYLEGYEDLQDALDADLDQSVSIDLEIVPERIWAGEENKVFMDARWNKTVFRGSGAPESASGTVTFIFIRYDDDTLKLLSQKGNPVFP
jgi:hypothetical protein